MTFSIALHISNARDFVINVCTWGHAPIKGKRFPKAKLNRENSVCFIFNEHGDLYCKNLLVYKLSFLS